MLTALKVHFKKVKKDEKMSEVLLLPLQDAKKEVLKRRRRQVATTRQQKNWVDYGCLQKDLKRLRQEVFSYNKNDIFDKKVYHKLKLGDRIFRLCGETGVLSESKLLGTGASVYA